MVRFIITLIPNAMFIYNIDNISIDFYAIADINDGQEITINYNEDSEDKSPLWFDVAYLRYLCEKHT